ncbi:DUF6457 domain-containing protein [Streptomyces physcomitrii]|uniref:NTP transferase domain-containing protein n=1 Tax=Streptomyces physcomitrii TaxID=2724184 RepID=A0ABX1GY89_9ACTN|nr:DUF6457 domain-containing protein [Streptomyces physcomitrii]NKI41053.1 NTP transferase domain-containing protein [Streptomyces physcomitrii]
MSVSATRGTGASASGAPTPRFDAVVLAGGGARRLGGADKPGLRVGGRRLLDRVLTACAAAERTVVVAAPRATVRPVRWTREEPPGSGPVAALAAGLRALDGGIGPSARDTASGGMPGGAASRGVPGGAPGPEVERPTGPLASAAPEAAADPAPPYVLVLSADLPFLDETVVRRLLRELDATTPAARDAATPAARDAATPAARSATPALARDAVRREGTEAFGQEDAVLLVDAEGRDQPLVGAYQTEALRRRLDEMAAAYGGLEGLPLRRLTEGLVLGRLAESPDSVASFDCDTWADLATARTHIREHGHVLDEWISAVKDELGVDLDVDTAVLLDLARDAAHSVARPAAPLTTFLVGYAAGRAQGGPEEVAEAARKAAALALRWAEEQPAAPEA